MIKWLIAFGFILVAFTGKAQKHYITNQYIYDLYLMNPAAAAFYKGCYSISGFYQKQWFGIDQAPTSQILSYEGPLTKQLGFGSYFYNDRNGYFTEMGLQTSLSYEIILKKRRRRKSSLTFGMSLDVEQSSVDHSDLGDGAILDPALGGGKESGFGINANAGILFKYNRYHAGFAVTNLLPHTNSMYKGIGEPQRKLDMHVHVGTTYKVGDRDIFLEPFLMYRRNLELDSKLDLSVKGFFPTPDANFSYWGLVSYRRTMDDQFGKSLGLATTVGVQYQRFIIGVEYQVGLTSAQVDYGSAYQLVFKYRVCRDRRKASIPCSEENRNKSIKRVIKKKKK